VPEALPVLVDALQSQDARVRKAAAIALGQLRAHAAVSSLVGLLEDEEVRDSAAAALLEIGSASGRTAVEAHREVLDMTKVQAEQARIQRGKRLETLPGVGVAEARELCRLLLIDAGLSGSNLEPSVESCVQETKAQY
jgi:HEAT repeat protein